MNYLYRMIPAFWSAGFLAFALMLVGCGGGGLLSLSNEEGKVVDPAKVPAALTGTGLHVVFRRGPRPANFDKAIYGTARNIRGVAIDFGFFFVPDDKAEGYVSPEIERLVPNATDEGTTAGMSFIEITSAGAHRKPTDPRKGEELSMAGTLGFAVAKLAPKAFDIEGP
jgi:hypothetical protein